MAEPASREETTTRTLRVGILALVAALCVAAIANWIHHDLSLLFVLAIAVIGIGQRGAVFDSYFVVAIEAAAVIALAIATFAGSDAFLHAASAIVAVIAIGKIAFLQLAPAVAAAKPAAAPAKRPVETEAKSDAP
jgi:hypothetical protein